MARLSDLTRVLFLRFFLFLRLIHALPAAPPDDGSSLLPQSSNFSDIGSVTNLGHPHFSVTVHPEEGTRLESIAMLMNAVDALAAIAVKDQRGRSPRMHFHSRAYPSVHIDIEPKGPSTAPLSDVSNEVATLCLYYGTVDMIKHQEYKVVTFSCLWDNVEVAVVYIDGTPPSTAQLPGDTAMSNTTDTVTDPQLNALQPNFFFIDNAKTLGIPLSFVTIMNALKSFFHYGSTEIVPRCFTNPGPEWDASILFFGDGPVRTRPPFLEYRYVIETLRQAPEFMWRSRKFAELGIGFNVDGVPLGAALLMKGKPHQSAEMGRKASVATA